MSQIAAGTGAAVKFTLPAPVISASHAPFIWPKAVGVSSNEVTTKKQDVPAVRDTSRICDVADPPGPSSSKVIWSMPLLAGPICSSWCLSLLATRSFARAVAADSRPLNVGSFILLTDRSDVGYNEIFSAQSASSSYRTPIQEHFFAEFMVSMVVLNPV